MTLIDLFVFDYQNLILTLLGPIMPNAIGEHDNTPTHP
jgi:hypothetical protein